MQHGFAFAQGIAAGILLWTGLDGSLSASVERVVALPAGAAGDFLAFLLVAAWGALVLALAWNGVTGATTGHAASARPSPRPRRASPRRRSPASA